MTTTTDVGGGVEHWTAAGDPGAPAIVFIHGTRLTRAQWAPQMRRLARTCRCVALDLPAHGTRAREPFSFSAAAEGVREAIDVAAPGGRAVLVGLSLGGYVAIETATRYPERIAGLVLAGCSAEPQGLTGRLMRSLAWILEAVPWSTLDAVNRTYFRARYPASTSAPIVAAGFWYRGGASALRALVGRRFAEQLGRLWTPVLVVNGALDPVFGPGGEPWAACCRRGTNVVIPWAGHLSNLDRPVTFSGHVDTFIRSLADAP
jgi:pimeloyl-ACP methyl ester carboxylesterase